MKDKKAFEARMATYVESLRKEGVPEDVITTLLSETGRVEAALDNRICPQCSREGLSRKRDTRQDGYAPTRGTWFNYACEHCGYFCDRNEPKGSDLNLGDQTMWDVTITGADDNVDPKALLDLSKEFPFVEWGILRSEKRAGTARYPTMGWVSKLPEGLRLSLHLCGSEARSAMIGSTEWYGPGQYYDPLRKPFFRRIQINGYKPGTPGVLGIAPIAYRLFSAQMYIASHDRLSVRRPTLILPFNSETDLDAVSADARVLPGTEILFDPSGGRGKEPFRWPTESAAGVRVRMGYAGGINPDNVVDVLRDIGPVQPTWIDMESGVRTNDAFDLRKVRHVLEAVRNKEASREE